MSDFDPFEPLLEGGDTEPAAPNAEPAEPASPAADPAAPAEPQEPAAPATPEGDAFDVSVIPEEHRPHVERLIQEATDYRQGWEPYEALGINEVDPQGLEALLQFAQDISDPETAREALLNIAKTLEIELDAADPADPDGPDPDVEPDPTEDLRARLERIEQEREQTQEQARIQGLQQQAETAYRARYAEVEQLHGKPFSNDEKVQLIDLARRFQLDNDEPIKAAYQFINSIRGGAEAALVNSQPTPPAPAEPAGRASSPAQPWTTGTGVAPPPGTKRIRLLPLTPLSPR